MSADCTNHPKKNPTPCPKAQTPVAFQRQKFQKDSVLHPSTGDVLDHQSLDLVLESADLVHEIRRLVGGDAGRDDGAGDTAGAAERGLGGNVDIWHVLVLAEEGKVEEDGERGGVGREDDDLGDTTVEGLGRLVGTLLQLTVVAGLLDNVEDLLGEGRVGDGPSWE